MSVLVYTESINGQFKKYNFETVSFANEISKQLNIKVVVVHIGEISEKELLKLGNYGAEKIINIKDHSLNNFNNLIFTKIIAQIVKKENSSIIIFPNNNSGKAIAPRLSARLKAGFVSGVISIPNSYDPFIISKKSFTSKAISKISINTPTKIISLSQNCFGINESKSECAIENFIPEEIDNNFKLNIKAAKTQTEKILLSDAEIVVSGGRGMKGPENWGIIEELANILGAATACSRPVSDDGWRPHHEHVGQTGKIIAPNLYIACGISGAIQHIGGISSSKCIVAINKDPEAPIFDTADYGVIGDVQKVLPELIAIIKEFKNN